MNGLLPLVMNLEIQLPTDEITTVEFEYLKIEKHYFTCFSLFHEEVDCPSKPSNYISPKDRKLGITQRIALQRIEADKKKHDHRRGYSRPQESFRHHDRVTNNRDMRQTSLNRGGDSSAAYNSLNQYPYRGGSFKETSNRDRSRAYHHSEVECNTKELSSGKVSSHTPPPRPVRERLEFTSEQSSERTLSNSNERRSALERISEPDLRNSISRDKPRSSGVQDRLMVLEGIEGSSSAPRIPAPLRLQDSDSEGQINITIPHAI
ncbi:unnamed protein product, partial [Brassica oleracea var. botrytis]